MEPDRKGWDYLGTILVLNRSSSDAMELPSNTNTYWIGWDVVYQAMKKLLEGKIHPNIRENIDEILSKPPLDDDRDNLARESPHLEIVLQGFYDIRGPAGDDGYELKRLHRTIQEPLWSLPCRLRLGRTLESRSQTFLRR